LSPPNLDIPPHFPLDRIQTVVNASFSSLVEQTVYLISLLKVAKMSDPAILARVEDADSFPTMACRRG
jgi:hypothetical protein